MAGKAALKAVRTALDSKEFELAATKATALIDQNPENYHANLFLGLALDKLGNNYEAENAYLAAIRIKGGDKTAWQGLILLYEKQGNLKLDAYREATLSLGQIYSEAGDRDHCVEVVEKFIKFAEKYGSRSQYKQALLLHLPDGPLYDCLEGRVPHPADTYLRIIEIAEAEEKEFINHEIGERRTRLGAKIDQVTVEVKREVFERSELDELYRGIVHWSGEDEIRRKYEEKLLQRAYDFLVVLPDCRKAEKRKEVYQSARDMIIIKHPFEPAWEIVLEWQDVETFEQWDLGLLKEFIEFFPEHGLSKVLQNFLTSDISPFANVIISPEPKADDETAAEMTVADRLILMTDGFDQTPSSIIAHRIMSELYLSLGEYESAVDTARKGLIIIKDLAKQTGLDICNTTDAVNITLATALITHQSPRNHPEAKGIFESVLQRRPTYTSCLLGIGLILEEDQDYEEAVEFLERALQRDPSNLKIRVELSWCTALKGDLASGLRGLQAVLSDVQSTQTTNREFQAEIYYKIGQCQWKLDPSTAARKDRNRAYASFLASIQSNMNYAPAYTSLGTYYADYKKDKTRARRCFQKAFELSAAEIEAAERLARSFADQKEWDLVEAVAQRIVDLGNSTPAPGSKRKGHSWPHAALGVVQINRQQYVKSIVSFQAALRISPGDYHSWVGLAESYHNSGRYISATKAFEHAQELEMSLGEAEKSHIWFARYMLANVKRELGEYGDAIARYEEVLKIRPAEYGVAVTLLQTLTESAWKNVESGLFSDAADNASEAIMTAVAISKERAEGFNLWKAVGDACAIFSYLRHIAESISTDGINILLSIEPGEGAFDVITDTDGVGRDYSNPSRLVEEGLLARRDLWIYAMILAYKRAIWHSANDVHAQAVAWYNLGWAEYRAYRCTDFNPGKKGKRRSRKSLKAAVRCFKRAIESEAGNSEFWNALGVVTASLSPKVAQHSFVRSLHLNERSAQNWTNLGAFYLIHQDLQLSNNAFTRAQSADPDYAHAWLGQGFLAVLFGDAAESRGLFTHALEIATSSSVLPKERYSLSLFDHLLSDRSVSNEISQLIQPFFALHQLHYQEPTNLAFEHLSALIAERVGEYSDAQTSLQLVCSGVEAEYELVESRSSLIRFAQANADIARTHLANLEYEEAAERAETALTLSSEEEGDGLDSETIHKLRLSAHLTAGLAFYYLKSMDKAIDMFRDALREADNDPDVVCLLAQVLWAKGGEEERNVAREQLFDCVERHPEHVGAVTLLGAIVLLDTDQDATEAVHADLYTLRMRENIEIHDRSRITKLLAAISALGLTGYSSLPESLRRLGETTTAVMLAPAQPHGWMELASTTGERYPAEMAVQTALRSVPPRGPLDAEDLCQAYTQTGKIGDSFRAIMVAPWRRNGWGELVHALTELA
ncbi:hypothetical protein V8E54_010499 [Elaphomyces granulatus]